jgi:hypothetical protein
MKANGGMNSQCTFALWQPAYAERGIATFPVRPNKVPAISGYQKIGLPGSQQLAFKFADAELFGFMCGPRSKLTILDIDSSNEAVLGHGIARYGITPIVVRTASGKWHAYYRHNGERRRIRPFPGLPIDVLGDGGFVIAPPSKTASGHYEFMDCSLDDLDRLPIMQPLDEPFELPAANSPSDNASSDNASASPLRGMREHDGRNTTLFRAIGPAARQLFAAGESRDALLELAMKHNGEASEPMSAAEVNRVVDSVWRLTCEDRNWIGRGNDRRKHELSLFKDDTDALYLLDYLRVTESISAQFWIANGLADNFGWALRRFTAARQRLVELGYVQQIRPPRQNHPAVFVWPGWTRPF